MKTVIITGAGASNPYGFPLGTGLKSHFMSSAQSRKVLERLKQMNYDASFIAEMIDVLQYSRYTTIDQFLESRKLYREIGGFIIAEALIKFEKKDAVFPSKDWYLHLFEKIKLKALKGEKIDLSVVTLNYDRSLEYYLQTAPRYECHDHEEEEVLALTKSIPVIHAHGSLGGLDEVPFHKSSGELSLQHITTAGKNIQIISDKLENSPTFQLARKTVAEAERLIFLGFAYHPTTMKGLLDSLDCSKIEIIGTSRGLSQDRADEAKRWTGSRIKLFPEPAEAIIEKINI